MESKLYNKYPLRACDFTRHDNLSPYAILDIFQDIAGKHSNSYGMTFENLMKSNQIWVLLRVKYKVIKQPSLYTNVIAITYPKKKSLVDFDREFQLVDENGDVLINGISKWVILNAMTRKIIPCKYIDFNAPIPEDSLFNDKFDRLKDFNVDYLNKYEYKVAFADIDHNGHVNNTKYAIMILNAINLNKNQEIDEFEINYISEVKENSIVNIYYYYQDNNYYVKGVCLDSTCFLASLKIVNK